MLHTLLHFVAFAADNIELCVSFVMRLGGLCDDVCSNVSLISPSFSSVSTGRVQQVSCPEVTQ